MRSFVNRLGLGLAALVIITAQAIMPVHAAFADKAASSSNNGELQQVFCNQEGNSGKWKAQIGGKSTEHEIALKDTNGNNVYVQSESDVTPAMSADCQSQNGTVSVTPIAPQIEVVCGPNNDLITMQEQPTGISLVSPSNWANGVITFTYKANDGYTLNGSGVFTFRDGNTPCPPTVIPTPDFTLAGMCGLNNDIITAPSTDDYTASTPSWHDSKVSVTFTIRDGINKVFSNNEKTIIISHDEVNTEACEVQSIPATAVAGTITDMCGPAFNLAVAVPTTPGITYHQARTGNTITVTASANEGYVLTNPNWSQIVTDQLTPCVVPPSITPCLIQNPATIITQKAQFATYYSDDRTHGHYGFSANGLVLATDDNSSEAKIAWYHAVTPYSLSAVGTPTMNYSSNFGITPGLQIVVDFNGDGTPDGTLVGESVYGNNWWLTNASSDFVKNNAPHNGGGNGSQWFGTLNEWLAAFPSAKVNAVGFSLGSGVFANGVLRSLTFGCDTWVFQAPADGGKGDVGPPTPTPNPTPTPTLTPTPATSSTPVVVTAGRGSLPAELPETGASSNGIAIAAITGLITYGAVYFAQPKRRYE